MRVDPARSRDWRPLLLGEAAADAWALLDEIATALTPLAPSRPRPLEGAAARALFFAYLAQARPAPSVDALVDRHLVAAVEELGQQQPSPGLHSGFVGVGWLAQHLVGRFAGDDADAADADADDANRAIDDALAELLGLSPWPGRFDLVDGLCGFGVYALERLAQPSGRALLAAVVSQLATLVERRDAGVTWHSPARLLDETWRARHPRGHYDCGAAHGVPGPIAILAGSCAAGIAVDVARPLLDGAVRWLLAQRRDDGPSAFPTTIADDDAGAPARLAWCYGDPGVAAALLAAARAVDEPAWADAARAVGLRAARRVLAGDWRENELTQASLCHGASGTALLLHRLWSELGDASLADGARALYRRTLALQPRGRAGGFRVRWPTSAGDDQWRDDGSLLTGAAGIGLALLAAVGTVEPAWDRLLAASLPPRVAPL